MSAEPGPGELQRSYEQLRVDVRELGAQLNARLDRLVTDTTFAAEQRRVDDKLRDLADDIAAEREARKDALAQEGSAREQGDKAQQIALNKLIANQKWLIAAVVVPVAAFLADLVLRGHA